MNEVTSIQPGAWGQVRVREPAGERVLGETLSIGGSGADIVVPGVEPGAALSIRRRPGVWLAQPAAGALVRFNGRPLNAERDLRRDDVLAVGDAQVRVTDASRTLLRLTVEHLAGNVTIAPAAALAALPAADGGDQELEIVVPGALVVPAALPATRRPGPRRTLALLAALLAGLGLIIWLATRLGSVSVEAHPAEARLSTPGSPSLLLNGRLWVLPGTRLVRAERAGYSAAEAPVTVAAGGTAVLRLVLAPLPGRLQIDTGGVVAEVSVDGVAAGIAPGTVSVPAGRRTITLRAPRHVDYVATLDIAGAAERQDLHVRLTSAWGNLTVTAIPEGAHVSVDGEDQGAAPVTVSAPSGVRRIRIAANGWKTWESSVVLKGDETLAVGPVTLGQPDAHLSVRSTPAGAEVTVAGTHRGRTPLAVDLPAGIKYPLVLSLPGYATWTREVFASAGAALSADARLAAQFARVQVRGEPADAELYIDGSARGHTPQALELSAVEHRIEVKKAGYVAFEALITPVPSLERLVQYHLTPEDRGRALLESAPQIKSKGGYLLKLVPAGTFQMGSERREQGRRPNEGFRSVTLQRPFYIGVQLVTNAEFRRFRADHASGFIDKESLDLDAQPVTQVSWEDAAEYCNWLSEQDGLPPAYTKKGDGYELTRPVTRGYRLPTEAEWEWAARYSGQGVPLRFVWGDTPPVPAQVGNLAGAETATTLPAQLPGYRDEYAVLAPIGRFHASALGLHDMSGNASQWVNDYYESFVDNAAATDPLGPASGKLHAVRGANWKTATVADLRLAWRDSAAAPAATLSFRLARYADDSQ